MKNNNNLKSWLTTFKRLCYILNVEVTNHNLKAVTPPLLRLSSWSQTEGASGVKRWKDIASWLTRWIITGVKPDAIEGVRKDNRGCPIGFASLLSFALRGAYREKLIVITILAFSRLVVTRKNLDTSSITAISSFRPIKFLVQYGVHLYRARSFSFARRWNDALSTRFSLKPSLSKKAGPNGQTAWAKGLIDMRALLFSPELLFYLLMFVRTYKVGSLKQGARDSFYKYIEQSIKLCEVGLYTSSNADDWHSRLCFLADKAGKTRVVALGDHFTQSALKPLHDHLYAFLRQSPLQECDGTFDQDKQRKRVRAATAVRGRRLFSFDLTAATDRIPIKVQALFLVLAGFMTAWQALWWILLMTGRSFKYKLVRNDRVSRKFVKRMKVINRARQRLRKKFPKKYRGLLPKDSDPGDYIKEVRYAVGQPMGFYSSWGSLAVCHHLFVQLSAMLAGRKMLSNGLFTRRYALLGDDIVIWDDEVANQYRLLMEILGVGINPLKSIIGLNIAEFAKSLFFEGRDFTPVPPALCEFREHYAIPDMMIILNNLLNRGLNIKYRHVKRFMDKGRKLRHDFEAKIIIMLSCPLTDVGISAFSRKWESLVNLRFWVDVYSANVKLRSGQWSHIRNLHENIGRDPYKGVTLLSPWIQTGIESSKSMDGLLLKGTAHFETFLCGYDFSCIQPGSPKLTLPFVLTEVNLKFWDENESSMKMDNLKVLRKRLLKQIFVIHRVVKVIGFSDQVVELLRENLNAIDHESAIIRTV